MQCLYAFYWNYNIMGDKKFKKGDKVKCSHFVWTSDNIYIGTVGIFYRYNSCSDGIAYINFGQDSKEISCFTYDIELLSRKNEQLVFNFMLD